MPLADIANVNVSLETQQVSRASFSIPCVAGYHTRFAERGRYYSSLGGMTTDGFATTDAEYKAVAKILSQSPRVKRVFVARRALAPTMRWAITPVVGNATVYKLKVHGSTVSYTSDASATMGEIISGLKTAIDALALAITVSDQTTYMRIVADVAGAWFEVESVTAPIENLLVAQDHADPGIATDLAAINTFDPSWYGLTLTTGSSAEIVAAAAWVEANGKVFAATSQDTLIITSQTSDVGTSVKTSSYARTFVVYHPNNGNFAGAAWMGRCFPYDPGVEAITWKFKELAGVAVTQLTTSEQGYAEGKNVNFYYDVGGGMTSEGVMAVGEFIDNIIGRDWYQIRLQERIIGALRRARKIGLHDKGIAILAAELEGQNDEAIAADFFTNTPPPLVVVPLAADVPTADKAVRNLTGISSSAHLANAVHMVTLNVTISV